MFGLKAEEERGLAVELLHRIGDVEAVSGLSGSQLGAVQVLHHGAGRGLRGVHDLDALWHHAAQQGAQEGIVGAAEDEHVHVGAGRAQGLYRVSAGHLLSYGRLQPALFHQRHQQRTGLLIGGKAAAGQGALVGVAVAGGLGGKDQGLPAMADGRGGVGTGFDNAEDGDADGGLHVVKGQRRCRVAADHQQVNAAGGQKARGQSGIAGDELLRLGAVRQARRVAKEEVVGVGNQAGDGSENGEAADAGVEDSDDGTTGMRVGSHLNQCNAKAAGGKSERIARTPGPPIFPGKNLRKNEMQVSQVSHVSGVSEVEEQSPKCGTFDAGAECAL